jgi:two-component system, chemotaxis family, CheB/CheR fusion protein
LKALVSSNNNNLKHETPENEFYDFLYRSFLDAVAVGMWVSDRNGNVKFFNKSWLEFTGRTLEEELSHKWRGEEIYPDDRSACLNTYLTRFKSELSFEHEYRLLRHDAEFRWIHEYVKPYYGKDNTHTGFVGTCVDVTERKEAILFANEELREKNKDLEQFAYVASHDLQEPLRKIQSFGELIKSRFSSEVPEQAQDYIHRMQRSASRMRLLIDDLLTFSRISSRAKPFTKIDLTKEVKFVISDLDVLVKETKAQVDVETLPVIDVDPSQLRQLLLNLISNGLKYHRKNVPPVINVSSNILEVSNLAQPHSEPVQMVELIFQDNGIGFDEKYKARIFEPFQRLHGRNEFEGTGIGLAICKRIVERHQGNIKVSSIEGQGTEFKIQLPITQKQVSNDEQ